MNEQETREKIKEIVAPYVSAWGDDERIANDLIAAGIGDIRRVKSENAKLHRAIEKHKELAEQRQETAEYEHESCMEWFRHCCEYKARVSELEAENAGLRARLKGNRYAE